MKYIDFTKMTESTMSNAVIDPNKVSPKFVDELKEAFRMFPTKTDMRFKQSPERKLIISVTVVYSTGLAQHLEGAGDADLISAINLGMAHMLEGLSEYNAEEHDIEVAKEGEDLVMELFKQYLASSMRGYIETDWYTNKGERYRCMRFTSSFNGNVKFCLKATDEVNNLISEACKPEWMKIAETKQAASKSEEVA